VSEPIFLSLDEVLQIHSRSLAEHGGTEGTRDPGLVESALGSAKNTFYYGGGDLFDVAGSYAFHLAEAQASWMATSAQPSRRRWFFSLEMVRTPSPRNGSFTSL
jgi:hypothetical protein